MHPFKIGGASFTKLSGFLCNLGVADELHTLTSSLGFSNALVTILVTYHSSSIFLFSWGLRSLEQVHLSDDRSYVSLISYLPDKSFLQWIWSSSSYIDVAETLVTINNCADLFSLREFYVWSNISLHESSISSTLHYIIKFWGLSTSC